jgi:hypothetical protein
MKNYQKTEHHKTAGSYPIVPKSHAELLIRLAHTRAFAVFAFANSFVPLAAKRCTLDSVRHATLGAAKVEPAGP